MSRKSFLRFWVFGFLSVLASGLTACGVSPLLNHLDPWSSPQGALQGSDAPDFSGVLITHNQMSWNFEMRWMRFPSEEALGEIELRILDSAPWQTWSDQVGGVEVTAQLWMPEHGHGSSPIVVTPGERDPVSAGRYRLSDIFFVMPGRWVFRIVIQSALSKEVLAKTEVEYVAP